MFEVLEFWAIGIRKQDSCVWMFGIVLSESSPNSESALPRRYERMPNSGKNCAVQELEGRLVGEEIASNS